METSDYIRFVVALVFVLALIGLLSWLVRRFGFGGRLVTPRSKGRRLQVVEATTLDSKRRVVLLRRDQTEHLIVIGGESDLVIETGIPARDAGPDDDPVSALAEGTK